jgi:valyl-tRNA synthetase
MPYITEELWQRLPGADAKLLHKAYSSAEPTIMLSAYPESSENLIDELAEWEMRAIIDLISRIRNIRSEMSIKPGERVPVIIGAPDRKLREVFLASTERVARLVRASDISIGEQLTAP